MHRDMIRARPGSRPLWPVSMAARGSASSVWTPGSGWATIGEQSMTPTDVCYTSATDLARRIRERVVSPVEVEVG